MDSCVSDLRDNLSYQYEWDEERGRPDSWLRLIYYGGESDSHPLLIDLTQSAEFADPVRFEGGVSDGPVKEIDPRVYHIHWLEEEAWPNGTIGDPIAVSDSGEMLRFEVTVSFRARGLQLDYREIPHCFYLQLPRHARYPLAVV